MLIIKNLVRYRKITPVLMLVVMGLASVKSAAGDLDVESCSVDSDC
jgi:hypothetical protein